MWNYLSIQGAKASRYHLSNDDVHNFRGMMQCLVGSAAFIVSSQHRTDIVYRSRKPRHLAVEKLLRLYLDIPEHESVDLNGVIGREKILVRFFDGLAYLKQHRKWFSDYLKNFRLAFKANEPSCFLEDLIQCDQIISKNLGAKNTFQLTENDVCFSENIDDQVLATAIQKINEN